MITWTDTIPYNFTDPVISRIFGRRAIFFDIETTGFSREGSTVYLIGCATRDDDSLCIRQFFAETPAQEAEVIAAFFALLKQYDAVLTFNGNTFDIPYLQARCHFLHLEESLSSHPYTDLYREAAKLRHILGLASFKQKSIETFLGIDRADPFSGGELIRVYREYIKKPTKQAEKLLQQHNYEDVLYMPALLPVLSYRALFDGEFSVKSLEAAEYTAMDGSPKKELYFTLSCRLPVPAPVSCRYGDCYLSFGGSQAVLRVCLLDDTLRFFFDRPSDYYYLPDEDCAVLKTAASHIEKDRRSPAKRSSCYTKKHAIFVPQYQDVVTPAFRRTVRERQSFFELSASFVSDPDLQHRYVCHLLNVILRQKPPGPGGAKPSGSPA